MKKVLIVVVTLLLLVGCGKKKEEVSYEYKITGQEALTMLENKETFVIYIGTTDCSACKTFKPVAIKMNEKYGTHIYHIDIDLETEEMQTKLLAVFPVEYTPSIHLVKDGETIDIYEGAMEYIDLKEYLTEHEYIK